MRRNIWRYADMWATQFACMYLGMAIGIAHPGIIPTHPWAVGYGLLALSMLFSWVATQKEAQL